MPNNNKLVPNNNKTIILAVMAPHIRFPEDAASFSFAANISTKMSASNGSDSEEYTNVNDKPTYSRRAFSRTFVHLDKRLQKAPTKKEFEKLEKAGRAKDLALY